MLSIRERTKIIQKAQVNFGYRCVTDVNLRRRLLSGSEKSGLSIFVDADALPGDAKRVLFRAAERTGVEVTLVANVPLSAPAGVETVVVSGGFNVADDWIVERVQAGDLVITADIPLASRVVDRGAVALDPRGHLYTEAMVKERLATRNLLDELRGANILQGGGPAPFGKRDVQRFANGLNAYLSRR